MAHGGNSGNGKIIAERLRRLERRMAAVEEAQRGTNATTRSEPKRTKSEGLRMGFTLIKSETRNHYV